MQYLKVITTQEDILCMFPFVCPVGFVRLDANHSYLISNATASWREARNMCIQYGGDLVVIETVEELEELKDYIVNIGNSIILIRFKHAETTLVKVY